MNFAEPIERKLFEMLSARGHPTYGYRPGVVFDSWLEPRYRGRCGFTGDGVVG